MDYKKATERNAVKNYLKYYGIKYDDDDIIHNQEYDSVDISVPKYNLQFQVTTVEGAPIRLIREKRYSDKTNIDEAKQKFIITPVLKKIKKIKVEASKILYF